LSTAEASVVPTAIAQDTLRAMVKEVAESSELYRPSKFWVDLNEINQAMLDELGLDNLKRTLAQNYFNWLVTSKQDPQYRAVRKLWMRRPSLQPYRNRLEAPSLLKTLQPYLGRLENPSMPVDSMGSAPAIGSRELRTYKLFVGMLWEYSMQQDWSGIGERAAEPTVGNPIGLFRGEKLISQDLANSIREYNSMLSDAKDLARTPKRVAELGAGYGRVAHVFLSDECTKYFIFDIPPALFVSQWYLGRVQPGKKVFEFRHFDRFADIAEELETADVAFFTPNQMELFPDAFFDIFASISTLPEMAAPQIDNYLRQAERLASRYVYLKQWIEWENPADAHRVTNDSMRLTNGWIPVFDRPDAVQPNFFERLWRRNGVSDG
jgi:putative sugar O-methyltransferase